jgi:phosphopantothenoylcysteine synthetase/decarboxylase
MAAENTPDEPRTPARDLQHVDKVARQGKESAQHDSDEDDDDDDEVEEEPKLKYSRLTRDLGPVYRNGDATATFMVAGDKMVRS